MLTDSIKLVKFVLVLDLLQGFFKSHVFNGLSSNWFWLGAVVQQVLWQCNRLVTVVYLLRLRIKWLSPAWLLSHLAQPSLTDRLLYDWIRLLETGLTPLVYDLWLHIHCRLRRLSVLIRLNLLPGIDHVWLNDWLLNT